MSTEYDKIEEVPLCGGGERVLSVKAMRVYVPNRQRHDRQDNLQVRCVCVTQLHLTPSRCPSCVAKRADCEKHLSPELQVVDTSHGSTFET